MRNIGINVNTSKDIEGKILSYVIKTINNVIPDANIFVIKDSEDLDKEISREFNFVISLGGDGTILRTARELAPYDVPILGVNIGNLGFLTEVGCSELYYAIKSINEEKYCIEERMMLQCTVESSGKTYNFNSLNDIVLSKGTLARMAKYDIDIDETFYTSFTADGVILSTPTGSTAYSLSAGGPIIYPTLSLISITPICPHSIGVRTMVIDGESKVTVRMDKKYGSVFLTVDGQESLELKQEDTINVSKSAWKCKLIKLENYNYFNLLRKKITSRSKECEGDKE